MKELPLAFLLVAVNPASVQFAGDLKYSSLLELFMVVWVYLILDFLKASRADQPVERQKVIGLIICGALLSLTHYLGLVVILASFLYLSFQKNVSFTVRRKFALGSLGAATLMVVVYFGFLHHEYLIWLKKGAEPATVLWTLVQYSKFWGFGLILFVGVGLFRWNSDAAGLFLVNGALLFLIMWTTGYNLAAERFLIPLYALTFFIVAEILTRENKTPLKTLMMGLCVLGALLQAKKVYGDLDTPKSGWKAAAQYLTSEKISGPAFVFGHVSLRYYFPEPNVPEDTHWENYLTARETFWFTNAFNAERMKEKLSRPGGSVTFKKLETFEPQSFEPVFLYSVIVE